MIRKIIKIDGELCNGCGLCATACHEGAIGIVDGKAKLLRDDFCDGLGDCLPVCPTGAISFENREAAAYDDAAVKAHMQHNAAAMHMPRAGCPGSRAGHITRESGSKEPVAQAASTTKPESMLSQWPVQIKLVPQNAPYFNGAHLLIAADCTAFAYGNFHSEFIKNRITIIGCPKLDDGDYSEKLTEILTNNDIKSVTIARMEVPCCGGIAHAAEMALKNCGKMIPWSIVTISTDGQVLDV